MTAFEIGIQFHLPTFRNLALPDFVKLAQQAQAGGVGHLWVTDNLQSRNSFVVLTAIADKVPVKLGTAVTVQYFRNPVDVADSVAAITELMGGREFTLGVARGNRGTPRLVQTPKPVAMLRETGHALAALLGGEAVRFGAYPTLADYFHLEADYPYRLHFAPAGPVHTYCGGNGPLALAIAGAHFDGVLFGGTFQSVARAGHMGRLLAIADEAAASAGRPSPMPRVAEIKLSVARDGRQARDFVRRSAGTRALSLRERGYSDDDYRTLGIDPADIDHLQAAEAAGRTLDQCLDLIPDSAIDAIFVAGDPAQCTEKLREVCAMAATHGYQQLMFSELGPDEAEGLHLLCDEVLPKL